MIPIILMVVLLMSVVEQVKIYSSPTNNAVYTKYCFMTLLFTNVVFLLLTCFSVSFGQLYPFLINQTRSRIFVLAILIMGILLSALILHRLNKIKRNEDKQYKRIKEYEKIMN